MLNCPPVIDERIIFCRSSLLTAFALLGLGYVVLGVEDIADGTSLLPLLRCLKDGERLSATAHPLSVRLHEDFKGLSKCKGTGVGVVDTLSNM